MRLLMGFKLVFAELFMVELKYETSLIRCRKVLEYNLKLLQALYRHSEASHKGIVFKCYLLQVHRILNSY